MPGDPGAARRIHAGLITIPLHIRARAHRHGQEVDYSGARVSQLSSVNRGTGHERLSTK